MNNLKILILIYSVCVHQLFAQELLPLISNNQNLRKNNLRTELTGDSVIVTLPFFDDFSDPENNGTPNKNNWKVGGGTDVNNTRCISPPTFNVATFNGINSQGQPYDYTTDALGKCDSLVSNIFDLSSYSLGDSLYLSFYLQAGGKSDAPDPSPKSGDTLYVQFLNQSNVWTTVWKSDSTFTANIDSSFKQVFVKVQNNVKGVFHKNFRFKFLAVGKQTGDFDNWHLDYVYFNKNRSKIDTFLYDRSFSNNVPSFLVNYYAMPWNQYTTKERRNNYPVLYKVKYDFGINPLDPANIGITIRDEKLGQIDFERKVLKNFSTLIAASERQINDTIYLSEQGYDSTLISGPTIKSVSIYQADQADKQIQPFITQNPTVDTVTLRNDTIYQQTELTNYYAYDDGKAEYAYYAPVPNSSVAYKFWVNNPDTLTEIKIHFANNFAEVSSSFKLRVWTELYKVDKNQNLIDGTKNKVVYSEDTAAYSKSGLDQFATYKLDSLVIVTDTFYIGFVQTTSRFLQIGFDQNEYINSSDRILANTGGSWQPFKYGKGNLMMRPVFGTFKGKPAREQEREQFQDVSIVPNPSTGEINITGIQPEKVEIFDITGKRINDEAYTHSNLVKFNLSNLTSGIYFISISKGGNTVVKRVILIKN